MTPRQPELKEFDLVTLRKKAQEVVNSYPLHKKFIDGTPLENDMATIMATFAYTVLCLDRDTRTTPPVHEWTADELALIILEHHCGNEATKWLDGATLQRLANAINERNKK